MSPIIESRLAALADRQLAHGGHDSPEDGLCVMEAVAFVAGEEHSDTPDCACPVIGALMRTWNDAIRDDETRTRLLKPFVTKLVGSRSTPEVEQRRADLALDWLIRVHAPAWLDLSDVLKPHAAAIRALPPVLSVEALTASRPTLLAASKDSAAAWDAARTAAWDAARTAAWDAARAAARAAARTAAWDAARAAARDAAWAAARAAARTAPWDAARAAARDAAWDAA
ncbi:MAG: hypothetical protein AB7O67_23690, partial [Vicinamibacterales bacterium]